ncbi:hypothetical protein [uncultured Lamprocystis sp.]|jgi:hypothetical protein|uniref:hypothetical protein n=1 Tax=uncultured Lamprocystis sp. TaxID=543132 RepID=UPI0025CEEC7A|nr:hypothetical protein [uncultured Lamprocystis sp.]
MDSSYIELKGSEIELIESTSSTVRIAFPCALIIKNMTGSKERTRWSQAGVLVLEDVSNPPDWNAGSVVCAGGDIDDNVYTYRDMIPIPFSSRGLIRCALRLEGASTTLLVEARSARLEMEGVPKYLDHLR